MVCQECLVCGTTLSNTCATLEKYLGDVVYMVGPVLLEPCHVCSRLVWGMIATMFSCSWNCYMTALHDFSTKLNLYAESYTLNTYEHLVSSLFRLVRRVLYMSRFHTLVLHINVYALHTYVYFSTTAPLRVMCFGKQSRN